MAKSNPGVRSIKINWLLVGVYAVLIAAAVLIAKRYANPAPPSRIIIATGDDEGDYQIYAAQYKEIIKKSGVELVNVCASGPVALALRLPCSVMFEVRLPGMPVPSGM